MILTILKNMKVNIGRIIPYMKWKIKNVPNHQPEYHGYIMDMELPPPLLSLSAAHQGRNQDRADHEGIQQDAGDDPLSTAASEVVGKSNHANPTGWWRYFWEKCNVQ